MLATGEKQTVSGRSEIGALGRGATDLCASGASIEVCRGRLASEVRQAGAEQKVISFPASQSASMKEGRPAGGSQAQLGGLLNQLKFQTPRPSRKV